MNRLPVLFGRKLHIVAVNEPEHVVISLIKKPLFPVDLSSCYQFVPDMNDFQ